MEYLMLKHLHMSFAALSGALFVLRGVWMLRAPNMLQRRWVRIVPHIVDTILLASAIGLAVWSSQYPFAQSWLTAKVLALIGYIVLGTIALKRGSTRGIRAAAFAGAVLLFLYMMTVARTRVPLPFFG